MHLRANHGLQPPLHLVRHGTQAFYGGTRMSTEDVLAKALSFGTPLVQAHRRRVPLIPPTRASP